MTIFLLILSILIGYLWMIIPNQEWRPFANDMSINSWWYMNLLCYKIRFVLLVSALIINLKGTIRLIGYVFFIFYCLNLIEYAVMYSSPNSLVSFIVKGIVSLVLITAWNYGARRNNLDTNT